MNGFKRGAIFFTAAVTALCAAAFSACAVTDSGNGEKEEGIMEKQYWDKVMDSNRENWDNYEVLFVNYYIDDEKDGFDYHTGKEYWESYAVANKTKEYCRFSSIHAKYDPNNEYASENGYVFDVNEEIKLKYKGNYYAVSYSYNQTSGDIKPVVNPSDKQTLMQAIENENKQNFVLLETFSAPELRKVFIFNRDTEYYEYIQSGLDYTQKVYLRCTESNTLIRQLMQAAMYGDKIAVSEQHISRNGDLALNASPSNLVKNALDEYIKTNNKK